MSDSIQKWLPGVALCLIICRWSGAQTGTATLYDISLDSLSAHIAFLGSDALAGRSTGTQGSELAAHYIAYILRKCQIAPFGDDNTYFQPIPMHGSTPLPSSKLSFYCSDQVCPLALAEDYVLYKSGAQTFVPNPTPLYFVGYGIAAPEFDYNDYADIDVNGKIVVYLSGEPPSDDPAYFNGSFPSIYSYAESKERMAIARGARGSILIPNPQEEMKTGWADWRRGFLFEDVVLAYSVAGHLSLALNPKAARKIFSHAEYSFEQVLEMSRTHALLSFPLNGAVSFRGEFKQREFLAKNVLGWIEGSHPRRKNEYLILSAHYDHLGIGQAVDGDSIYNGVGDNAIGVAGLLEIARLIKRQPQKPERSVIFLFTTGEEKGLLGATFYLDHAPVPHYKTVANINIDGLAMFDEFKEVVGVGADLSSLGSILQGVIEKMALKLAPIPIEFTATESFSRSDQMAFAAAGIPAILIMEGPSYLRLTREEGIRRMIEWSMERYHTPFDDLSQPIFLPATRQHCRIIYAFANRILEMEETPEWIPGTPYINARLQSIAKKR
ncbi:M20/M25/M40 family metallo-hydrolase [candidate division KSB1 bacterium]|nr:M20/M25/M40 family metallo-hydrolase [candidate division KSB1 bacterium]